VQPARAQRIFHPTDPPKGASPGAIARRENWNPRMATNPGDVPIAITMCALSPNSITSLLFKFFRVEFHPKEGKLSQPGKSGSFSIFKNDDLLQKF